MSFFNEKEDVLEIQLTQFGKHLLAKGKWKPFYYAFFDDDVLYDSSYAGVSEAQNDTQNRIKEDTPYSKIQYVYSGIETDIKRINKLVRAGLEKLGDDDIQPTTERAFTLSAPLGDADIGATCAPAWSIRFLSGEISSSVQYTSGSYRTLRIPQINSDIEYQTSIKYSNNLGGGTEEPDSDESKIYKDGSTISVKEDFIVLEINEENTDFLNENFEIEVFKVEQVEGADSKRKENEKLIPLSFRKKRSDIDMNTLLLKTNQEEKTEEVDPSMVEYFFDVLVDDEIDEVLLCQLTANEKEVNNIFSDMYKKCKISTKETSETGNIYKTEIEDFEDCD